MDKIRAAALANPVCPPQVLLAASRWMLTERALRAVATNPNCPPAAFEHLLAAGHAPLQARTAAARNRSCPPEMLDLLSFDRSQTVRCAVASNPNCSQRTLEALAADDYNVMRGNVAYNPSTPAETLAMLCGDPDLGVRSKAADNSSCPPDVLAWIAADKRSSWQAPSVLRSLRRSISTSSHSNRSAMRISALSPPIATALAVSLTRCIAHSPVSSLPTMTPTFTHSARAVSGTNLTMV